MNCMTLEDGHDVAITGAGAIDGQGAFFWRQFEEALKGDGESGDVRRPRLIQLHARVRACWCRM